jgi:hypothetical protein
LGTPQTSKYFKLLNFLASRFHIRIAWVVEIKMYLFLGKRIIILSSTVYIKLSTAELIKAHRFSLSSSNLLLLPFTACCAAPTFHSMAGEADHIPRVANKPIINENKSYSEMESDILLSSSSNVAAAKMAEKTTPEMVDYWKKTMITKSDQLAYHSFGCLMVGWSLLSLLWNTPQ